MKELFCDIAVIGAGVGGLRAAIAAASDGKTVVLTEETDWIGGQLTAQGVPPDEHWHIEQQGATSSYREYRRKVREHYRSLPDFSDELKARDAFDPGGSWVSRVAHEPTVAHAILSAELQPYLDNGLVTLLLYTVAVAADVDGDTIRSVTVEHAGETVEIFAKTFVDATDCGDLLPIVGAEYRTGAEAKSETGEPHAADVASPADMQPVTWVFALEMTDGLSPEDRMEKPPEYDRYASLQATYDDNNVFSWYCIDLHAPKKRELRMFSGETGPKSLGLWEYRRIRAQANYKTKINEVSLINWPQQDYCFGNLFEDENAAYHRTQAKAFARCLAYWIQNDAPRIDGGFGYPVRLAKGVLGTEDGFAKAPYIRESRRIVAKYTVREQELSMEFADGRKIFPDSVGVGLYSMDLHETIVTHTSFNTPVHPFEIPLGALIPVRMKNLLPACKNIGTTHYTSGCYRLHPVEWNIGESVGHLAAFCLTRGLTPAEVYENELYTKELQDILVENGVQLHWDL